MYIHFPNMYIPHSIYNTHSCVVCAYNTYIYIYTHQITHKFVYLYPTCDYMWYKLPSPRLLTNHLTGDDLQRPCFETWFSVGYPLVNYDSHCTWP